MNVKFNKFERVAGLFVLFAFLGALVIAAGIAIKRGWFETKIRYSAYIDNAEGIHPGTVVRVSGLRAGSVDSVDLQTDNRVLVRFTVLRKFQNRIRQNSVLQSFRPFIIGDKILEITVGKQDLAVIRAGEFINYKESIDLMDFFSGRNVGNYLQEISALIANLGTIAQAFSDPKRTEAFIRTFDNIAPLTSNLNTMSLEVIDLSRQLTVDSNIGDLVSDLKATSSELNKLLPVARKVAPKMVGDMVQLISNLNELTTEFKKLSPLLVELAPQLPETGERAMEALDETVVVLKALQKTWLLSGAAEEVREEEQLRAAKEKKKTGQRLPASETADDQDDEDEDEDE